MDKEEAQIKASRTQKIVEKLKDISFKDKIMKECEVLFFDPEFENKLDENYDLIGYSNGVYDLANEEFRDGKPDDYIFKCTNVDYYQFNMKNPFSSKMLKFFEEILPNEDVRKYLLLSLSTCVSGYNKEEKLIIASGSGSNGKSLLFSLVQLALGDYYISCPITIITRKRNSSNQASPELLRIKGARCGCFQETDNNDELNVGIMKEITGNDSFMVRGLYSEPVEVKPQIKFFLACNETPQIKKIDGGTLRRLVNILFGSKFVDSPKKSNEFLIDNMLKQKIQEWGSIFSSYLIYLYVTEYKKLSTLKVPEDVKMSTNMYIMENDHFTEFFINKLEFTENKKDTISIKTMYEEFKLWFKDYHEGANLPKQSELNKFLTEKIGEAKSGKWKFYKIKVNPTKDKEEDDDDDDNDDDI
jgi:P4 family phage/plasmid primase-like protien